MLLIRDLVVSDRIGQHYAPVNLVIDSRESVCILGPNGVGKSRLLESICGQRKMVSGEIEIVQGNDSVCINDLSPENRLARGLVYVPSARHVFANLTVAENLEIVFRSKNLSKAMRQSLLDEAANLAPGLKGRYRQMAGTLSGGEQRALALTRALILLKAQKYISSTILRFPILILDEPTHGLDVAANERLLDQIRYIREIDVALLVAEQSTGFAHKVADRVFMMSSDGFRPM